MCTIAIVTIGQTPRRDITEDLKSLFSEHCVLKEYGVLEGLSSDEAIRQFGYEGKGELLITRIGENCRTIRVAGEKIKAKLQDCICRAEADGADLILLACTGAFPEYQHSIPLLLPGACQREKAIERAQGETIGVVIPDANQMSQIKQWWTDSGAQKLLLDVADPYGDTEKIVQAAIRLKKAEAKVICLDCVGFTTAQQTAVAAATGLETVLPRAVLSQMLRERLKKH